MKIKFASVRLVLCLFLSSCHCGVKAQESLADPFSTIKAQPQAELFTPVMSDVMEMLAPSAGESTSAKLDFAVIPLIHAKSIGIYTDWSHIEQLI